MKTQSKQKRVNIIYGIVLAGLVLYAAVVTSILISYKDSIDGSFWNGVHNDSEFRTEYQQHVEKHHPEDLAQ